MHLCVALARPKNLSSKEFEFQEHFTVCGGDALNIRISFRSASFGYIERALMTCC